MESWQLDFEWLKVRTQVKETMGRPQLPDLNAILFLIGIQELGEVKDNFTKEEKQDLMHIAVCRLLSYDGYYEYQGLDADGWPHWKLLRPVPVQGMDKQEEFLKEKVVQYFRKLESSQSNQ